MRLLKYTLAFIFLAFMSSFLYAGYQEDKIAYLNARNTDSEYYWCIDDTSRRYYDVKLWLADRRQCDIEFKTRYYK